MPEPLSMLCVDDEVHILNVIRRQLFDIDIEIYTALSAKEGLALLPSLRPVQIILSDYRMPGMNGIDFLEEAAEINPSAFCIILSGYADINTVKQSLEDRKIHAFLRKPWSAKDLQKAIAQAMSLPKTDLTESPTTGES